MALKLTVSILIDRPVEQVWAYLNDERHDPVWRRPYCKRLRREGPLGIGTRYDGVDNMGPYVNVITRFEPPTRLTWREESRRPMQQQDGSYVLSGDGTGSNMTLELNYVSHGIQGALTSALLRMMAQSIGRRLLNQLKAEIEQEPAR
jgi:uncharacterized protein YndB with AHSA1/START domain